MRINLEDLKETQKKLNVYIPSDTVETKRSSIFNEFKNNADIKGFRKGKAPNHFIQSMYEKSINKEVVSELISESFENALKEADVSPVSKPELMPGQIEKGGEFHYSAVFEIIPKFQVSNYEGLDLKKSKIEVKKEDIERALTGLRERVSQEKLVEENREVKTGDIVIINFEGKIDGKTVKYLKQDNAKFTIGTGQLLEEFEKNIIGLKKGGESSFNVEYKEDFQYKEAAGKTVNYVLNLVDIYDRVVPVANNNFAKELGFKNLKELEDKIKEDITLRLNHVEQNKLKEQIIDICNKNTKVEIPESLIEAEESRLKRDFAAHFQQQGIPVEDIDEKGQAKFREIATTNVKSSIIFAEIAKRENINPSNKEIQDRLKNLSDSLHVPMDKMLDMYQDKNMMANLEASITEDKVVEFIKEKAIITEGLDSQDKIDKSL